MMLKLKFSCCAIFYYINLLFFKEATKVQKKFWKFSYLVIK